LLVGVNWDGTVAGVRVLAHRETPGLGDGIEAERSDWIESFQGKSLGNPPAQQWAVKKDGGAFDQFTGATITPRAVVGAVRRFLEYYRVNRERLFLPAGSRVQGAVHAPPPDPAAPTSPASTGPLEANAQDPIESVQDTGEDVEQVSKP
ncbi:MAG: RnfABCDGE type electron transport complex subunit G, partial [Candidatus Competibacteraceae bacterium]|nr:RnfABCDGE type electron transport complex subunit G [Candidatus Competibacteraceae bacterium]